MRLFLKQLRGEIFKLFARKRTYIGFAAFFGIEMLLLFLLRLPKVQESLQRVIEATGYVAEGYLSGLTLALMVLLWSIVLLGSLYLALVSGDLVSKEVEDGTLRMVLCRPISRFRLIALKALAAVLYTVVLVIFISVTALLTGLFYGGVGGLFVFAPFEGIFALYDFDEGLARYFGAIPLLSLSLLTISALGLFFSCLNVKPAAATILTLSFFLVDVILKDIPYFSDIREWFLTAKMNAWLLIFEPRIAWIEILQSYVWLIAIQATLVLVGAAIFDRRDFKS